MRKLALYFQRTIAALFFLLRAVGWVSYPYAIEKSYSWYSFLMMAAFVSGVVFTTQRYKSKYGLWAVCLYMLAMALTLPHAVGDWKISSKDALLAMTIRITEMLLLLSLAIVALISRGSARDLRRFAT